jgi:hypothetical protein
MVWAAAQASVAARGLLAGQVVTVGVLGCGLVGQLMLAGVVRFVPGVSHVSLYAGPGGAPLVAGVLDQLDLAGVGFVPAEAAAEAVRGANLVIVCDDTGVADLRIECLSPHCVVVNASGVDLPEELVDRVDAIYVDDMWLLNTHRHRWFVRSHHAAAGSAGARPGGSGDGPRRARVCGEVGRLPVGRPGPYVNRVVLVELLGEDAALPAPEYAPAGLGPAEAGVPLRMIVNDRE